MKRKILYESEDGIIFNTADECAIYEQFMDKFNRVQDKYLHGRLTDIVFSQIDKDFCYPWIHKLEDIKTAWDRFKLIATKFCEEYNIEVEISNTTTPENFPGYLFTDRFNKDQKDYPCVYLTWNRFCSIDMETGKEFINAHLLEMYKNKKKT